MRQRSFAGAILQGVLLDTIKAKAADLEQRKRALQRRKRSVTALGAATRGGDQAAT